MKIANIFYAIIFFISTCTINSYGALNQSQVASSNGSHAQELHQLIKNGSSEKLKIFFKEHPELINVSISDEYPFPPLSHYLCYWPLHVSEQDLCDTVQMLIDFGAGVNPLPNYALKKDNWSLPIMQAIENHKSVRLLEILFSHGASCNAQDQNGTILQQFIHRTFCENEKLLLLVQKTLQYGANPYLKSKDKNCFDVIKYYRDYCVHWSRRFQCTDCDNHNNYINNLALINKIESLLKTHYLKPTEITKTATKFHLTYTFHINEHKAEELLKTAYIKKLKPKAITKTDTQVHLTYTFQPLEN